MKFEYGDIKTTDDFIQREKELSKTEGGRTLLKNINRAYLSRLIDTTQIAYNPKSVIDNFASHFTDIVRPNKFIIRFTYEDMEWSDDFALEILTKTVTAPSITTNKMTFKRAGKTVKIPLNQDVADNIELAFYQDVDNKVLNDIVYLINNQNEAGYHDKSKIINLSIYYMISINKSEGFTSSLTDLALDFFDINLGYRNSGNNEPQILNGSLNTTDKIVELKYKNIFIDNISGIGDMDNERVDTYSEAKMSLGFNGVSMSMWDWNKTMPSNNDNGMKLNDNAEDEQIVEF